MQVQRTCRELADVDDYLADQEIEDSTDH